MIYIRGQPGDYDRWQQMGCAGWSFAEVLPYFRRAEANENGTDDFHGGRGPLYVGNSRSDNPLFDAFVEAGVQAGYRRNGDFNGADQEGFGRYQLTIKDGRRCSAASAYLRPALGRPNLEIRSHALGRRVLFEAGRATGLEFIQDGQVVAARADRDVILSCGAVQTPQLLMLSGVGDGEVLRRFGIATVQELKGVGRNLQDHLDCSIQHECTQPITFFSQSRKLAQLKSGLEYLLLGSGVATGQGLESGAFLKSGATLATPDLQFHFVAALMFDHMRKKADRHGFMTHVCHLQPESRGHISIRSADPSDPPLIQPNYLSTQDEARTLRKAIRLAREIFAQAAFAPYRGPELMPGSGVQSDDELDAFIRASAETIYHPVGTARMGQGEDTVVDPELRVHGLSGLRVVDASVMPTLICGNTNAATIMIAEKAADLILGRPPAIHESASTAKDGSMAAAT